MKKSLSTLFGAGLLLAAPASQAIMLGFEPSMLAVTIGSTVDVAVVITGLGNGAAPSIGDFDLSVSFDPAVLTFSNVAFGDPTIGDQLDLFGLGSITCLDPGFGPCFDPASAGVVNLLELSFDLPDDLNTLQAENFTLATLNFNAQSAGMTPLNIAINTLGDAFGNPLTVDSIQDGKITSRSIGVPEPAGLLLLAIGLLGLWRVAREPTDQGAV